MCNLSLCGLSLPAFQINPKSLQLQTAYELEERTALILISLMGRIMVGCGAW
jgi:hypothetical protein